MRTLTFTLAASAALLGASAALVGGKVEVGSTPSHIFRESPLNGMGVKSLDAYRGRPVLVEFWGTH